MSTGGDSEPKSSFFHSFSGVGSGHGTPLKEASPATITFPTTSPSMGIASYRYQNPPTARDVLAGSYYHWLGVSRAPYALLACLAHTAKSNEVSVPIKVPNYLKNEQTRRRKWRAGGF